MSATEDIDELCARGAYLDAAALAVERGDLPRAIGLFERVWRFADAIPLALRLGDRPLAARLALDAGDAARAGEIAASIPGDDRAELEAGADAFARRGRPFEAARLCERAGGFARAADLYRKAGAPVDAARALELGGDLHQAGVLYERIVELGEGAAVAGEAVAAGRDGEVAAARLALGRLLGRLGRHEDAARALQAATKAAATAVAARRALCGELLALGYRVAAVEVLRRLRRDAPDLPPTPEDIAAEDAAASPSPAAAAAGSGEASLLRRRFRVQRLLGSGATGRVYLAEDTLLGRPVAVKLLSIGAGGSGPERQAYLRFCREAEAAGRLRHPNIVALFDFDEGAGMAVMEYLPGGTLAEAIGRGPLPPVAARRLALDLLAALGAAHERGIVHRDIKPQNVFFDAAGNAKLGDFGAAHLLDFGQTQTGGFVGTVAYMSPEQITGAGIGPPADLYALGATLFEALTGRRPFLGPDIVAQHLGEPPPAPSAILPSLSSSHDAAVRRALRKAPVDRWGSSVEMAAAIRAWPTTSAAATGTAPAPPPEIAPGAGARPAGAPEDPARAEVSGQPTAAAVGDDAVEIGRTAGGRLVRRTDARVGRPILVEEHDEPLDPAGLARVRALASAGGPYVQRVLAVSEDGRSVSYESIVGPPVSAADLLRDEPRLVAAVYQRLKAAGVPREAWPRNAARTPGGPVFLVAFPTPT